MLTLFYGAIALLVIWQGMIFFSNVKPQALARMIKRTAAVFAFTIALVLLVRGRLDMALLLSMGGLSLLGWSGWRFNPFSKQMPGLSQMRSKTILIMLDIRSGMMTGQVLEGPFAGRALASLTESEQQQLLQFCCSVDPEGVVLLETYLDRLASGWRKADQADRNTGTRGFAQSGAMTEQEAYQILGLEAGASTQDIRRAHRTLMKKFHPDQGGTTYLAVRINQAKDLLLAGKR
jgi:DnaJ-domain-containing protein 1